MYLTPGDTVRVEIDKIGTLEPGRRRGTSSGETEALEGTDGDVGDLFPAVVDDQGVPRPGIRSISVTPGLCLD